MRVKRANLKAAGNYTMNVEGRCGEVCARLVGGGWAFGKDPVHECPLFRKVWRDSNRHVWVECAESIEEAVALALQDEEKP